MHTTCMAHDAEEAYTYNGDNNQELGDEDIVKQMNAKLALRHVQDFSGYECSMILSTAAVGKYDNGDRDRFCTLQG